MSIFGFVDFIPVILMLKMRSRRPIADIVENMEIVQTQQCLGTDPCTKGSLEPVVDSGPT